MPSPSVARDLYVFLFPDRDCVDIFLWLLPGLILTSIYAIMRGAFWGNKQPHARESRAGRNIATQELSREVEVT